MFEFIRLKYIALLCIKRIILTKMPKYFLYLFCSFFFSISAYSQNVNNNLESIKKKFYLYNEIGADSSIYYMNKLLKTNKNEYKAFAYAAIEYLKTREKKKVNSKFYNDSINKYLSKTQKKKENYTILFDTHILIGNTSKRRGLLKSALENYLTAENYANLAKDIERTIKIKGNIALIYQNMEELTKAVKKGKQALRLVDENRDRLNNRYYVTKRKRIFNLAAIYSSLLKDQPKNQVYADSTLYFYNSLLDNKNYNLSPFYKGKVYSGLGTTYSIKKEYAKAASLLEKSLIAFKNSKSYSYLYKGYYNTGYNYYLSNDYNNAKTKFLAALDIKKDTIIDDDYLHIHECLSEIYLKEEKVDSANYYFNKYSKLHGILSSREKEQYKETLKLDKENDFNKKLNSLIKKNTRKTYIYNGILFILITSLIVISFSVVKNKREKKEANKRLEELLNKKSSSTSTTNNFVNLKDSQNEQIIKGLLKIEQSHYYLKEDFNLYNAAKKIGTNTTYLSKVVKEYKKMSFSDYTNELRINYIVDVLTKDKKIRSYTTQAIGELGGYKNAKSFTRIFKKYTGITPYQFVEKIDKEL